MKEPNNFRREDTEKDNVYHKPVLFQEVLDGLKIKDNGIYVDCTFGGGGHSRGILERLGPMGRLVAFDQDADTRTQLPEDPRFLFVAQNFRYLKRFLRVNGITGVDGILADLGVSSHQFDEGERGFSIRFDGPLDMRMNRDQDLSAAGIIQLYSAEKLQDIFSRYGEVRNAKTLASWIVKMRAKNKMDTIGAFQDVIAPIIKGKPHKYLAQVFQALRIEVNDEYGALEEMLQQAPSLLNKTGRIAVITFHSGEDRIVKQFFREASGRNHSENPWIRDEEEMPATLNLVNRKPLVASQDEIRVNPRSHSAKLRIAEKL